MKSLWALAFGVLFGLLASGIILLVARQPRGEPIRLTPPPTPLPLLVHVSGAVLHPGVCELSPGSRVREAIQAAGGFAPGADKNRLNLAAFIEDGELIWVPARLTEPGGAAESLPPNGDPDIPTPAQAEVILPAPGGDPGLIDINTATLEELESLPGIGPVTAQKIIDYRETYGAFARIEAIQDVSGIGPATFEKIKDLITIGYQP